MSKRDAGVPPPSPQNAQQPGYVQRSQKENARMAKNLHSRHSRRLTYCALAIAFLLIFSGAGVYDIYSGLMGAISGVETEAGELPDEYKTAEAEQLQGIINILVCGIDYSDDEQAATDSTTANSYSTSDKVGNTDLILYVRYDTTANEVTILQLPRDIFVGEEIATGGYGKINSVYKYAADTNNRMAALAQVLYTQLRLPVDYYITLDMDALKEIIDIKGSIEVYVPIDVDNPETGDLIPAGWRAFSSGEAEYYLRNRYSSTYAGQGDIMRLQMQQYFYSALFREFKTLQPQDLVMWLNVLLYRAKTDIDVIMFSTLAQSALSLQASDITFIRPSVGGGYYNNLFVLSLLPDEMAEILNTYFRAEGESYTAAQLDIHTVPIDDAFGISAMSIRTMGDIMDEEDAYNAA